MEKSIHFTIKVDGRTIPFQAYSNEYRNLMVLLKDFLCLEDFGECGGMGRCATCIVQAFKLKGESAICDRNEPITLTKMGFNDSSYRLSCQIPINEDLKNATIEL